MVLSAIYVVTFLDSYLTESNKVLVWLMWGERELHHRSTEGLNMYEYYANNQHVHKRVQSISQL